MNAIRSLVALSLGASSLASAQQALVTLNSPNPGDGYGKSLAAGRIEPDRLQDLVVGAPNADGGAGAVYIEYFRDAPLSQLRVKIPAPIGATAFGTSVAVGNLNNDQYDDIVVGAPGNNTNSPGRWFVYYGGPGIATPPSVGATAPGTFGDRLGSSVAITPDVNGDGTDDILIGARGGNYVDVHNGGDGSLISFLVAPAIPLQFGTGDFGITVVGGDFDGDGRGDMAVRHTISQISGNSANVIAFGSSPTGGFSYTSQIGGTGVSQTAFIGSIQCAATGDANLDGADDLVIGFPRASLGGVSFGGRVTLFSPLNGTTISSVNGDVPLGELGLVVASAGDLNGDGGFDGMGTGRSDRLELFAGASSTSPCSQGLPLGTSFSPLGVLGLEIDTLVPIDQNGDGFLDYAAASTVSGAEFVRVFSHADLTTTLSATTSDFSINDGVTSPLFITAGPAAAGEAYFLVASNSIAGALPGVPLDDGSVMPFPASDPFVIASAGNPTLLFPTNIGSLNASGSALARLESCGGVIPAAFVGTQLHVAYLTIGANGTGNASAFVSFNLIP